MSGRSTNTQEINNANDAMSSQSLDEHSTSCFAVNRFIGMPIYPVRIAYSNLTEELTQSGITYPTNFRHCVTNRDQNGFTLRTLATGYIYVYTSISLDIWQYNADTNTFFLIGWFAQNCDIDDGFDGSVEHSSGTVYFRRFTSTENPCPLLMARVFSGWYQMSFSRHLWSNEILIQCVTDSAFRHQIMTQIDITAISDNGSSGYGSILDDRITDYVEEFAIDETGQHIGITHHPDVWEQLSDVGFQARNVRDLLAPNDTDTRTLIENGMPIYLVGLHDPVGVIAEMAMAHQNIVSEKIVYEEANIYPATIAKCVENFQNQEEAPDRWSDVIDNQALDNFMGEMTDELRHFSTRLNNAVEIWQAFYTFSGDYQNIPQASLQALLQTFNNPPASSEEMHALLSLASISIASISASREGQTAIGNAVLTDDNSNNIVIDIIEKVRDIVVGATDLLNTRINRNALNEFNDILLDLSGTGSWRNIDLTQEVTTTRTPVIDHVTTIYNHLGNPVSEIPPIASNATSRTHTVAQNASVDEVLDTLNANSPLLNVNDIGRSGILAPSANGPVRIVTTSEPGFYIFSGTHTTESSVRTSNMSAYGAGFSLFFNVLNLIILQTTSGDRLNIGQRREQYIAMSLNTVESIAEILSTTTSLSTNTSIRVSTANNPSDRIRSLLRRRIRIDQLAGANATVQSQTATPVYRFGQRVGPTASKIAVFAGVVSVGLDINNTITAVNRGNTREAWSNALMGVAGVLMLLPGGITTIAGVILLIAGISINFFHRDHVAHWLRHCFWGKSDRYWDRAFTGRARNRNSIPRARATVSAPYEEQRERLNQSGGLAGQVYANFFENEIQGFYEIIYQVQPTAPEIDEASPPPLYVNNGGIRGAGTEVFALRLPGYVQGVSRLYFELGIRYERRLPLSGRIESVPSSIYFANIRQYFTGEIEDTPISYQIKHLMNIPTVNVTIGPYRVMRDSPWGFKKIVFLEGWWWSPRPGIIVSDRIGQNNPIASRTEGSLRKLIVLPTG